MQPQPRRLRHAKQSFNDVRLDGNQQDFQLTSGRGPENLIIPNYLGQRKGNILLGLILNDLGDLGGINRGQFDKLGKNMETGSADVDDFGTDVLFDNQLLKGLEHDAFPGRFMR